MIEGWIGDDYLIFFDPRDEVPSATVEYGVHDVLPGYAVVGLRGWDDLILSREAGRVYTVPTVPIDPQWIAGYELPDPSALEPDARFAGRIKWYVKPIVFGGSPSAEDNVAWITHASHREFVRYWNAMYRNLKESGA
jgi:hypothetical protein